MKRIVLVSAIAVLVLAFSVSLVSGAVFEGTPSPNLNPVFGTLVDFDDKPTGTPVLWNDYQSVGVYSITEKEGLGFFARYESSQSMPNYVGTGPTGQRGTDPELGWDGTIEIKLTCTTDKIGIGVANSRTGPEYVTIYDCAHNVLETATVPTGANVYVYFVRDTPDIRTLEITGDWFAIDDLQFNPTNIKCIPEVPLGTIMSATAMIIALVGFVAVSKLRKH